VGQAKAAEWLLTGKTFGAREAQLSGLINEVYSDEAFFSAALQHAQTLAAMPAESVRISKKLMKQTYMAKTLQTIDEEGELFRKRLQSEDFKNAVAAFFKR
jgi:enoyl-CoA hydratase/carnithine racemase